MLRLASIVSACALALGGCYLSHDRDGSGGSGSDTGIGGGGGDSPPFMCHTSAGATVRFEPPMTHDVSGVRVTLLGASADAAVNGTRIHLDLCGGTPPCPVDLVVSDVGDALSGLTFPPGASGTLTTHGDAAFVSLTDQRDCASCGGDLDILAGALTSGIGPSITVHVEGTSCLDNCGDTRSLSIGSHGGSVLASAGPRIDDPPLHVVVVTDYAEPCARCRCGTPPIDATGIAIAATGAFAR